MKKLIIVMMAIVTFLFCAGPAAAYEAAGVNIHGFISQGFLYSDGYNYLATDTQDGSFEYNEVGLNFSKQLTDKLHIGLQLFSRDLGDVANNKINLDWAYADYMHRDWLGLRTGRIKLPLGLYNETRDLDMLRTSIVLPQGIYDDLQRDNLIAINGAGLYGNVNMRGAGSLEYQLLAGTINSDGDSGIGKYTEDGLGGNGTVNGNIQNGTSYSGALRWETPLEGLKLAYAVIDQERIEVPVLLLGTIQATVEGNGMIQVFSTEYTWNDLTVAAEYMLKDTDGSVMGVASTRKSESYYLSASYRLTQLLSLGAYYSVYYPDRDDKNGDNQDIDHNAWQKDLALTLRFDINPYWIFKIEGHAVDGTAGVMAADNPGNEFSDSNWYYGAAKLSFNF